VRGKNILWISLIAMLLATVLTINVGTAVSPAKLAIEPSLIPTHPSDFGHPGDVYEMSVTIDNAENVWALGFIVDYAPYGRPLAVSEVFEGPFLAQDGYATSFTYKINVFKGQLKIGITRLVTPGKPIAGASGAGVLCTFKFTVLECGDSDIGLTDVEVLEAVPIDPWTYVLVPQPYNAYGGYYHGCTADLINVQIDGGRIHHVGEDLIINSQARNDGDVDVNATVRFDFERMEDGRRIRMYSGQNYAGGGLGEPNPSEWHYCNGYVGGIEDGTWTHTTPVVGDSLIGDVDGEYAECTTAYGTTGYYTFEPITLSGRVILNIDFFGYTRQEDTDWDLDPYIEFYDDEGAFLGWAWVDSMGGSADWAWTGGRYYMGDPTYDMPEYYFGKTCPAGIGHTEEGFNNMLLYIENYCPSGPHQQIDAMKVFVEFSPITPVIPPEVTIAPKTEAVMPAATWNAMTADMVGTYVLTATLEYTCAFAYWIEGAKTRTITFKVLP
jgi:hypothetical protein